MADSRLCDMLPLLTCPLQLPASVASLFQEWKMKGSLLASQHQSRQTSFARGMILTARDTHISTVLKCGAYHSRSVESFAGCKPRLEGHHGLRKAVSVFNHQSQPCVMLVAVIEFVGQARNCYITQNNTTQRWNTEHCSHQAGQRAVGGRLASESEVVIEIEPEEHVCNLFTARHKSSVIPVLSS